MTKSPSYTSLINSSFISPSYPYLYTCISDKFALINNSVNTQCIYMYIYHNFSFSLPPPFSSSLRSSPIIIILIPLTNIQQRNPHNRTRRSIHPHRHILRKIIVGPHTPILPLPHPPNITTSTHIAYMNHIHTRITGHYSRRHGRDVIAPSAVSGVRVADRLVAF